MLEENKSRERSKVRDSVDDLLDFRESGSVNNPYSDIFEHYDYEEDGLGDIPHSEDVDEFRGSDPENDSTGKQSKFKASPSNGKSIETTSTHDSKLSKDKGISHKIKKTKFDTLQDEGKTYLYEDDPKTYMQIRK